MSTKAESGFRELLRRQRETESHLPPDYYSKQLTEWISALDDLYAEIRLFLDDYLKDHLLSIDEIPVTLSEDHIGSYQVNKLCLNFGIQKISLTPIGALLIGVKGRVDVEGPRGSARLNLVRHDVKSPEDLVRVRIGNSDVHIAGDERAAAATSWTWRIAGRPPIASLTPLTKDTFFEMLLEVSNVF